MPALLTRMSTVPKAASASRMHAGDLAGFIISAGEHIAFTPNSASMPARALSTSPGSPKPIPLVELVTTADLEESRVLRWLGHEVPISLLPVLYSDRVGRRRAGAV